MRSVFSICIAVCSLTLTSSATQAATIQSFANNPFDLTQTTGQQSIAHSQVVAEHLVSRVTSFSPLSLSGVDIVYCQGGSSLRSADIESLVEFVQGGGRLIVAGDHGQYVDPNNLAFEFRVSYSAGRPTSLLGTQTASSLPVASSILDGVGGQVSQFSALAPNDGLRSPNHDFRVLARYGTGQIALGQLSSGLGDVVFLTDLNTFDDNRLDDYDNQKLWTNLFAYRVVPEPATIFLALLAFVTPVSIGRQPLAKREAYVATPPRPMSGELEPL